MNQRTLLGRLLSPAGFGLVLIFFLLPFVTVSCGDGAERVDATFTGVDMAVGGEPSVTTPGADAGTAQELSQIVLSEIDLEPLALLSACAAIAGMAVGLLRRRRVRFASGTAAAIIAAALLVGALLRIPGHIDDFLSDVGGDEGLPEGMTTSTQLLYGCWLALVTLIAVAAGNVFAFWRARGDEPAPAPLAAEEPGRLSLDELT